MSIAKMLYSLILCLPTYVVIGLFGISSEIGIALLIMVVLGPVTFAIVLYLSVKVEVLDLHDSEATNVGNAEETRMKKLTYTNETEN